MATKLLAPERRDEGKASRRWYMTPAVVLVLGAVSLGTLLWTQYRNIRDTAQEFLLDDAIARIEVAAATSHLWLEEHLTGDESVDVGQIWGDVDRAIELIQLLLQGGWLEKGGELIEPLAEPELRRRAESLKQDLAEFRALAYERVFGAAAGETGIGSEIDQRYDKVFNRLLDGCEELRGLLEERWSAAQDSARRLLLFISGAWVLVVVSAVVGLWRRERGHKLAEKELRESRRWLATTLESIGDGVITTDLEGRVSFLNAVAQQLTGWPSAEALGQPIDDVFQIEGEEGGTVRHPVFAILRGQEKIGLTNHTKLLARGGERHFISHTATPIRTERWTTLGIVLVFRDMTGRKKAEAALHQRETELREAQKMEAVGRLAGGIAHDINNYLGAIRGYCEVAKMKRESGEALDRRMDEAIETTKNVSSLVKQLLAFSRSQPVAPEVVGLNRVVDGLGSVMRRLLGDDVTLECDCQEDLWTIEIDPSQVEQVLVNLLVNAGDAMPRGGRLTIRTRNVEIDPDDTNHPLGYHDFKTAEAGRYAVLGVSDSGVGIRQEDREKIFEPFFTTKDNSNRSGLGLATVYAIAQQNGGFIAVESAVGRGTTFAIHLPASDKELPRRAAPVPMVPVEPVAPARILLVEDNDAMRVATHDMLEAMGHHVQVAACAEEALRIFDRDATDLVISDVVMPDLSGQVLMERLRQRRPDMPCLFISGYADNVTLRHGFSQNRVNFLAKPFDAHCLSCKLGKILSDPAGQDLLGVSASCCLEGAPAGLNKEETPSPQPSPPATS